MRAVSTLRLSDKERELFLSALEHYGYENAATFLRDCAQALIVAHHHKNRLGPTLSFASEQPRQP